MAMKKFDDWKSNQEPQINESGLSGTERLAKIRAGATNFRRGQAAMSGLAEEENLRKLAKEIVGFIEPSLKAKIVQKIQKEPNKGKLLANTLARHLKNEINAKISEILKTPMVN